MKTDESKLGNNGTAKVKPPIQRRTVFHSNTAPQINTVPVHESLVSSSANGYQRAGSLSHSKNPSTCYTDFTTSLPSKFDPKSYLEYHSDSPYANVDFTASLPSNFDARTYLESQSNSPNFYSNSNNTSRTSLPSNLNGKVLQRRPMPKPRASSLNSFDDPTEVKSSSHNSCPPKVLTK